MGWEKDEDGRGRICQEGSVQLWILPSRDLFDKLMYRSHDGMREGAELYGEHPSGGERVVC